tara:strand:+ start:665 stop:871 length:207 start_codon:yes stop_codon:yes gene_type:complete
MGVYSFTRRYRNILTIALRGFYPSYIIMEITQFKQKADELVQLKAQISELEKQYTEKKKEIMDAYDEL